MLGIQDIQKVSRNAGGLSKLFLILERDIFSFPSYIPGSDYYQGSLQLHPEGQAYSIYFTSSSAQFQDNGNTGHRAGDYYAHRLNFKTPHDRPVLRTTIDRLRNEDVACVYRDRNNHFKIVRKLRAKVNITSSRRGGYNGATFELTGKDQRPAGFWEYVVNAYIDDVNAGTPGSSPSGGSGGISGSGTGLTPNRLTYLEVSGSTLSLTGKSLPADPNRLYIYRGGSLIPLDYGVTLQNGLLQFQWPLDKESVEIIYFT